MAPFSTGSYNGDGRQASHWKDSLGLGILDPTAAPGEVLFITPLDLRSLDAIGWDATSAAVPEPSSLLLALLSLICGLGVRARSE